MNTLRRLRNLWVPGIATIVLGCFSNAFAQGSYKVTDLGPLNDDHLSCAMPVNNHGWTEIQDGILDPVSNSLFANLVAAQAVLNIGEFKIDIGTLGGPNSWTNYGGLNDRGEVVGFAETAALSLRFILSFGSSGYCSIHQMLAYCANTQAVCPRKVSFVKRCPAGD